ncbi:MAG: hypothetical protein JWR04_2757 [Rhodoglobus sp.]|nr:hypothetical protein [Rhodoglobus sp.]
MVDEPHLLFVVAHDYSPTDYRKDTFELRFVNVGDNGYRTTFELTLRRPEKKPIEFGHVKIMRADMPLGTIALPRTFDELDPSYFSLGQTFSYYEKARALPKPLRERLLLGLRDIAGSPSRRRQAAEEPPYSLSLTKDPRARRAFEDAPRLLRREQELAPYSSQISTEWWAHLAAHGISTTIHFDFAIPFTGAPGRICALVGDNGTGKSAILAALADAAVSPQSSHGVSSLSTPQGGGVDVSRVISISYGAFDQNPYPPSDTGKRAPSAHLVQTRHFYRGLRAGNDPGRLKTLDQIEDEIWAGLSSVSDGLRQDAFQRVLDLVARSTTFPPDVLVSLRSRDHLRVSLRQLSSGQMMVLNILVSLIAYLEPGSLVLVDEPEVHLHPPLISALVRGISVALETFASVAILATHSSVVVQELQARNVFVLQRAGNTTVVYHPEIETYGESLGTIDREVFGLAGLPSDYAAVLESLALEGPQSRAERRLKAPLSGQAEAIFLSFRDED